uniref:YSIRK-type signal peptide-containing protein n=1 Tax=Granulicatella elegans TaxID=137732 RepID=UPI0028D59A07
MGKNNKQKPVKQFQRYGIRKFTQGVASVMIASGLFFLAGGTASANEVAVQTEPTTSKVAEETAPKKSEEKQEPKQEVKQEAKQEEKAASLNKAQLENYVNEITANIEAGKYASKTEESVAVLRAELDAAKATLSSATTQDELTKAYQKLVMTVNSKLKNKPVEKKEATKAEDTTNGKPTVGKAAENTEPAAASNSIANTGKNDERNGKEITEQGSQLRSANEGYTAASTELRKENG